MKVSVCEVDSPIDKFSRPFLESLAAEKSDLILLNEMPLGDWLANSKVFDQALFDKSVQLNRDGLEQLKEVGASILTSVPCYENDLRINQAVVVSDGKLSSSHAKQHFPCEAGFWETSWFSKGQSKFNPIEVNGVKIGVLLCTDSMFIEAARAYAKQGASIIVVPRATSGAGDDLWVSTLRVMAMHTGCYVLSSNRKSANAVQDKSQVDAEQTFNGFGFIIDPLGIVVAQTSANSPVISYELDLKLVDDQKLQYPCYVQ